MDNSDKNRIKANINELIRFTRYGELMDLSLKEKLLFPVMKEEIEVSKYRNKEDFARKYLVQKNSLNFKKPKF